MIKIGIAGGRGFVGRELLQLLTSHDEISVSFVGSSSLAGQSVAEHTGTESELLFQPLTKEIINSTQVDAWVIAQPNGHAGKFVQELQNQSLKLIDVSSDFRFDDNWCYGLAEATQTQIAQSSRVANPGCYATAAQLALLPLRQKINGPINVFGVSGYSGAGSTPNPRNDQERLRNNLIPYSLTGHIHEREISRHLGHDVRFSPHVAPFFRGITVTVNAQIQSQSDPVELLESFQEYYRNYSLVKVQKEIPEIRDVAESNFAILGGFCSDDRDQRWVTVVCVIDNLRKGAASQVVQNLNLMFGMPYDAGLV